jgi:hypothetical protein
VKRIVIGIALAVLGATVSAYAATNTPYTATISLLPNKAGTVKSPSALRLRSQLTLAGDGGNRTAPLTHITNTVYGLTSNGKDFPTCSLNKITNAHNDTGCTKSALVASGKLAVVLGPASNLTSTAATTPCARNIHVWNAGQGRLVFFLYGTPDTCGGLMTGAFAPFMATFKNHSGSLTLDLPIPNWLSFPVTGVQASLVTESISFAKRTTKVNGKTVAFLASVGCKDGKRADSTSVTVGGQKDTISSAAKCTR